MDAFNRYHKCFFTYERAMLSLIGHDYFLPNFKPGILAFTMYAIAAVFISTNLYTILYYEPFIKLNGYIFMCMAMAVSAKCQLSMSSRPNSSIESLKLIMFVFSGAPGCGQNIFRQIQ